MFVYSGINNIKNKQLKNSNVIANIIINKQVFVSYSKALSDVYSKHLIKFILEHYLFLFDYVLFSRWSGS